MDTHKKLIETAGRLFAERGFDGVSIRDIVAQAQVNLGAVTYHFGSKNQLFEEVLKVKTEPLRQMAKAISGSREGPEEKIRRMFEEYATYILRQDPGLSVLFVEMLSGRGHPTKTTTEGLGMRNRLFGEVLQEGIRKGIFRACDVEVAAWSFFGMLSGFVLFKAMIPGVSRTGRYSAEYVKKVVHTSLDLFLNGLRKDRPGAERKRRVR